MHPLRNDDQGFEVCGCTVGCGRIMNKQRNVGDPDWMSEDG